VSRNRRDLQTHAALNKELTANPSLSNCRIKDGRISIFGSAFLGGVV
jgi:hypothetical protein